MANAEKGEFDLVVGDRTYTLTLKTAGVRALQQHFSTPGTLADLEHIFKKVGEGSVEHIVVFVWAALRKFHKEITLEQTEDLIDDAGGLEGVAEQLALIGETTEPDPRDAKELSAGQQARPQRARATRGTGATGTSRPAAVA